MSNASGRPGAGRAATASLSNKADIERRLDSIVRELEQLREELNK